MAKNAIPDPLEPGHIDGQNPATPERMPGHTGYYDDANPKTNGPNEERAGGKPAFLFQSGEWSAITLDSSGQNLPAREPGWILKQYFTLGVRNAAPTGVIPEQAIRRVSIDGFYVWRTSSGDRRTGTAP